FHDNCHRVGPPDAGRRPQVDVPRPAARRAERDGARNAQEGRLVPRAGPGEGPVVTRLWRAARLTFRSMSVRNYRLYFAGQLISTTGTWMQSIAQAWLVLQITGSGVALGVTVALQFAPVLSLGA